MDKTTTPNAHAPSVLCVGADLNELPADVRDQLKSTSCECVPDVYRAFVRIARNAPSLVIVGVDWLPTVAFEFFEMVARTHRDLPVFVFGAPRAASKVDDALRRGATSVASADAIARIVAPQRRVAHPRETSPAVTVTPERKMPDTFAAPGNVFDAELDRRLREQVDADAEQAIPADNGGRSTDRESEPSVPEPVSRASQAPSIERSREADTSTIPSDDERDESGARVPWQRYEGRPQRVPPQRIAPVPVSRPAPVAPQKALDPDPPLLSAEEIAALMGDLPSNRSR